ncbi:hypothetical protein EOL70_14395 [Leucothrix sargassi]|nr:hypothetical protein EOL70_14395 [Leucothrix sargassi]
MKLHHLAVLMSLVLLTTACSNKRSSSIYVAGFSKHLNSDHPDTNEGNMEYFGYSQDFERNNWLYENTISTFIDSYSVRSYMLTSNISHESWLYYGMLRPMIGLNCAWKGYDHSHERARWLCTPPLKLRVGKETGPFANIMATPKVGDITNGLVAAEFGYKFKW